MIVYPSYITYKRSTHKNRSLHNVSKKWDMKHVGKKNNCTFDLQLRLTRMTSLGLRKIKAIVNSW